MSVYNAETLLDLMEAHLQSASLYLGELLGARNDGEEKVA